MRQKLFDLRMEQISAHNGRGGQLWVAGINDLTDRTDAELRQLRGWRRTSPAHGPTAVALATSQTHRSRKIAQAVDWRNLTAVKKHVPDQGACGSCWGFSATETLESHYQIASGKLLKLAPQTFVNCVKNPHECGGTGGCEGATMELAFNLTAGPGIALETDIPYAARDETCKPYTAAVKCTGYVKNPVNSAIDLETALATTGPQSVTVAAGSWQLYGGGVFHGCSSGFLGRQDNTLDHGVQAVGYTKDYWIVRNSWGPGWGEKGYIRLSRASDSKTFVNKHPADGTACKPIPKTQTVGGECGVLFDTCYPTGVTAGTGEELIV